jgi:hypothetical protein
VVELRRTTALSLLAGGNCPLQMRFGLHDAAGGFFLRVQYARSPAANWCVLQMQIGELLEIVLMQECMMDPFFKNI